MTDYTTTTGERRRAQRDPKSLCATIRKHIKAAGKPLYFKGKSRGPFNWPEGETPGFWVHKQGCSSTVSVGYLTLCHHDHNGKSRALAKSEEAWAIAHLRGLGYRIDDRGWLECDYYDECDGGLPSRKEPKP